MKMRETSRAIDKKLWVNNSPKTPTAICSAKYLTDNKNVNKILILCKKSLKRQWKSEITKFSDLDGTFEIEYIKANATKKQRDNIYNDLMSKPKSILITTYESVMYDKDILEKFGFNMAIVDESHIIKSRVGKKNKAIREVLKKVKYKLLLTGTPIMSRPADMFGLMRLCDEKYLGKWGDFEQRHIFYEFNGRFKNEVGYKELDFLRDQVQSVIIRRTEKEVSLQLPEIIPIRIDVDMDKTQIDCLDVIKAKQIELNEKLEELRVKYKQQIAIIYSNFADQLDIAKTQNVDVSTFSGFSKFLKDNNLATTEFSMLDSISNAATTLTGMTKGLLACNQAIANDPRLLVMSKSKFICDMFKDAIPDNYDGSQKTEATLDKIKDIIDNDEKVILFSKYERSIDLLASDVASKLKVNVLKYTGSVSEDDRDDAIDKFKTDDNYQILLGTDAMSEGLNLAIANHIMNYDNPDTPATKIQRWGRIRRADSKFSHGYMYDFITLNSVDIKVLEKLERASNLIGGIVEVSEAQSEALKKLM